MWAEVAAVGSLTMVGCDDKRNGQGTETLAGGSKYAGEFRDGQWYQGTITSPDVGSYVGEWRDDKMHSQGTRTYSNGGSYVGDFRDGKIHGQGTGTSPDGRFVAPIGNPAPGPAKPTLYYFGDKMSPSDLTVAVEVR